MGAVASHEGFSPRLRFGNVHLVAHDSVGCAVHVGVLQVFQQLAPTCKLSFPLGGLEGELPDDRNRVVAPAADVVGEQHRDYKYIMKFLLGALVNFLILANYLRYLSAPPPMNQDSNALFDSTGFDPK